MADVEHVLRRFTQAKERRGNWDSTWQDIADRVWPSAAGFNSMQSDGARRTEKMFDGFPAVAVMKFASAIESFACPSNSKWHDLLTDDDELNKSIPVKQWLESTRDKLFRVRYAPRANYAGQINEALLSYGAFGTGGLFIEDVPGSHIRYKSLPLGRTWILENADGVIDTVFRCIPRSARHLAEKYGKDKLPARIALALEKNPDAEDWELLHYVAPRTGPDVGKIGPKGMPWQSCYILPEFKVELAEGGYEEFPAAFGRFITSSGEVYARSPAWLALSNIKVLNAQKRTLLKAGQRAVAPPLLVAEDGNLNAFSLQSDALNFGAMTADGKPLVQALQTDARLDIGLDMQDRERQLIGAGFLLDVFTALLENPQMTATQALELLQERANIASPIVSRLQCQLLGHQVRREIQILQDAGQLDEPPEEMIEAGASLRIEYDAPANRAMKAGEGIAIMRTLEAATPVLQLDPAALDGIKLPEAINRLADINGVPADLRRSEKEIKAMREGRQQQGDQAALIDALPAVTGAASNLVKLQQGFGRPAA